METIMKAYFVEGKSLNSVDDMVACAEAAGISGTGSCTALLLT